jgi:hypothetical protein
VSRSDDGVSRMGPHTSCSSAAGGRRESRVPIDMVATLETIARLREAPIVECALAARFSLGFSHLPSSGRSRDRFAAPLKISPLLAVLRSDPEPRVRVAALLGLENYHAAEIGDCLLDMLEVGTASGDALSILCRQLWKYPSDRTVALLQRVLGSSIKLPYQPLIESTLAFLVRLETSQSSAASTLRSGAAAGRSWWRCRASSCSMTAEAFPARVELD